MRMVNRMIEISDGDILVGGESVRFKAARAAVIGYVIQQIGLFPHRTIGDNIATVPQLLGWDKKRTAARVEELLELIGLTGDFRDRYPAQLSGGQRQRVGVARALAADPPLMLMDEPFGAIDPINRERLQNEFLRLQAELRKTIVFVTHDIDEAIKMGDKIAILKEGGHLAQFGVPAPGRRKRMPPRSSWRTSWAPTARSSASRSSGSATSISWKAATVRVGEPVAEARASYYHRPLLVDDQSGRSAGCRSAGCKARACAKSCAPGPSPPSSSTYKILRDARPILLGSGAQYGPVVDANGDVAGVLSILGRWCTQPQGGASADTFGSWRPRRSRPRPDGGRRHRLLFLRRSRSAIARTPSPTNARATTTSAPAGSSTTSISTGTRCGSTSC